MIDKIFSIQRDGSYFIVKIFSKVFKLRVPVNNRVIIIEKGKERNLLPFEKVEGLAIEIKGSHNVIKLEKPFGFRKKFPSKIVVDSNNNEITIKQTKYVICMELYCQHGDNQKLFIDKNFSSGGTILYLIEKNGSIEIGEDCQFSIGICILNSDGHCIFDKNTKQLINKAKGVKIGDHVWLGRNVLISKNASIPDNCIIGLGSVVSKAFTQENSIISGNPSSVKKTDIKWERTAVSEYIS